MDLVCYTDIMNCDQGRHKTIPLKNDWW